MAANEWFSYRGGFDPKHALLVTIFEKSRAYLRGISPGQLQPGLGRLLLANKGFFQSIHPKVALRSPLHQCRFALQANPLVG